MAKGLITWSGATDDVLIQGYELSYKKTTDVDWIVEPFMATSLQSYNYTLEGLDTNTTYNVRVRTKDNINLWSNSYAETTLDIVDYIEIFRVNTGISDGAPGGLCSTEPFSHSVFIIVDASVLDIGDVVYAEPTLSTRFNGQDKYWLLGNFHTYKINEFGVITDKSSCVSIQYNLSAPMFLVPECSEITILDSPVFVSYDISVLGVGNYVYENDNLSGPLVGLNKYWGLGEMFGDFKVFKINNSGMITEVYQECTI